MNYKDIINRILVIIFPLGIIYSIGKALFSRGDFTSFLGCLFIGILAFIGGIWFTQCNGELVQGIIEFFQNLFESIKALFS